MNDTQFAAHFHAYTRDGVTSDPDGKGVVMARGGAVKRDESAKKSRKRRNRGDIEGEWWGSWAPPDGTLWFVEREQFSN